MGRRMGGQMDYLQTGFNMTMPSNFTLFSFLILGDGKSHLIRTRLRNRLSHMVLNIPINEAFTPLSAIKKLQALPTDTRGCCIYFNFTMLPPSVSIHISVCLKLYVHVYVHYVDIQYTMYKVQIICTEIIAYMMYMYQYAII